MKLSKFHYASLLIIALSYAAAVFFYPQMPEKIASHWGISGEADRWVTKEIGLFFMPVLSTALFFLFLFVPKMDPKWKNIEKFKNYFNRFVAVLFLFLFYLYSLTIAWNLNYHFNLIQFLSPAFGILFFFTGILIEHALPNFTIGIRTPWAIENPQVWKKTHEAGGKLFKISGVLCLGGFFFPLLAVWFIFTPVIIFSIGVIFYSYFLYKKKVL